MNCNIAVIKGDGIGPEVVTEAMKVLNKIGEKFGHTFHYDQLLMGGCSIDVHGVPLTDDVIRRHAPSQQLLLQHLENGGFTAATDTWQYLDQRLVDKRRDGLDIIRPVDHGIASSQSLVYPKYQRYATSF